MTDAEIASVFYFGLLVLLVTKEKVNDKIKTGENGELMRARPHMHMRARVSKGGGKG